MSALVPETKEVSADLSAVLPINRSVRRRMSDRVYDELVAAIRDLRVAPGALISETELSRQLNVSRTPLREAISRLADAGLVEVTPQVGTHVSLISLAEVEQATFIRESLESSAFERALANGPVAVRQLRRLITLQRSALDSANGELFFNADESIHEEIFRLAGFPRVWEVVKRSKVQLDRARRLILPEVVRSELIFDEHVQLVDALEAGNLELGRQIVSTHSRRVLEQTPQLLELYPSHFTAAPGPQIGS